MKPGFEHFAFTMGSMHQRVERFGDLFAPGLGKGRFNLSKAGKVISALV